MNKELQKQIGKGKLISKIYKQLLQLNIKYKEPNQKWREDLKQKFHERKHTDGQWPHEKMSILLIIR